MKQCTECGQIKDETEFYWATERGKPRRRARCRECCKRDPRDHSTDPQPEGRICTVCNEYKPLSAFHKHKICLYGVEPMCKRCKYLKRKQRDADDPTRVRRLDLKAKYGITLEEYAAMLARQQGQCAICGAAGEKLVVDHNHTTGRVRSLLCHLCNALIGCAREDIAILARAAAYLHAEQHPELGGVGAELAFASIPIVAGA